MDGAMRWRSTGELGRADQTDTTPNLKEHYIPSKDDGYAAQYNMKKENKKVLLY